MPFGVMTDRKFNWKGSIKKDIARKKATENTKIYTKTTTKPLDLMVSISVLKSLVITTVKRYQTKFIAGSLHEVVKNWLILVKYKRSA